MSSPLAKKIEAPALGKNQSSRGENEPLWRRCYRDVSARRGPPYPVTAPISPCFASPGTLRATAIQLTDHILDSNAKDPHPIRSLSKTPCSSSCGRGGKFGSRSSLTFSASCSLLFRSSSAVLLIGLPTHLHEVGSWSARPRFPAVCAEHCQTTAGQFRGKRPAQHIYLPVVRRKF